MAEKTSQGQYVPQGIGGVNHFQVKVVVPDAMVNADTLKVALAPNVPKDALPMGMVAATRSGDVYTSDADFPLRFTTHNRRTGETVFTVTGNIAAGTIVLLWYGAAG
jgi:hypothetical protein